MQICKFFNDFFHYCPVKINNKILSIVFLSFEMRLLFGSLFL